MSNSKNPNRLLYWLLVVLAYGSAVISFYSMLKGNPLSKYWSGLVLAVVLYGAAAVVGYRGK